MTKEETNWEEEFDRQFSYLPPKDNKPPIFMAKGDIKYNLADLQSGSILLPVGATIEKVDNTDVREELKNFISKLISQEKNKWYELGYQEGQRSKIQDWIIDIEEFENPERIKEMLDNYTSQEREKWIKSLEELEAPMEDEEGRELTSDLADELETYHEGFFRAINLSINLIQK